MSQKWAQALQVARGTAQPTLGQYQRRIEELEALQSQYGAPAVEQESPGAMMRIIDFFSRHNCHTYPWMWAYRYRPEGVEGLPIQPRHLEGADAPKEGGETDDEGEKEDK